MNLRGLYSTLADIALDWVHELKVCFRFTAKREEIDDLYGKIQYIVVEGNIGSGKTSLVKCSLKFSAHAIYEEFSDNPLCQSFMLSQRNAFPLELSFLLNATTNSKKN